MMMILMMIEQKNKISLSKGKKQLLRITSGVGSIKYKKSKFVNCQKIKKKITYF